MKTTRKGETPIGLLTTTRVVEADAPISPADLFEKLVRALAQEFDAVRVLEDDVDGSPRLCCKLPHRFAPVELRGPVRFHIAHNRAEIMFEARLRATARLRASALLGAVVWPFGWVAWRAHGAQRERAFRSLELAMERLLLDYRAVR